MRKIALVVAFGLTISLGSQATAAPWSFDSSKAWESNRSYLHIQESYDVGQPSRVKLGTRISPSENRSDTCLSFPSVACSENLLGNSYGEVPAGSSYPYKNIYFELVMPACQVDEDKDWCIEDLRAYSAGSDPTSASFIEAVTTEGTPAVPSHGIPSGGHISLWEASPSSGFAGLKLAVVVQANFVSYPFTGKNYVLQDFNLQVIPYELDTSTSYPAIELTPFVDGPAGLTGTMPLSNGCIWQRAGECGKRIDSPEGIRYGLTLKSSVAIGEFFNGRLLDPKLEVVTENNVTRLSVDANPVTVAEFGIVYDLTPELKQRMPGLTGALATKPYFQDAMDFIEGFRELAGDKASGENTTWRLSTTNVSGLSSCYANYGVAGLVTTNATTYGGEPPKLENGFLNYKVAGMHYLSNGTDLFVGTYDLIIKSEVARCLYGYSKAPVSATVTVVGDQGAENIATTVVSEGDGWLKLAAYGFTFSEKEIKVKITQPQTKTLTNYQGSATALTSKQKAEIRATVTKGGANPKFICTGIRLEGQPQALNTLVRKRAKLACDYAKSLNPKLSTFYQTKTTKARSYNGKVLVVSK